MKQFILPLIVAFTLTACGHMPKHQTRTSSNAPSVSVSNAPLGSIITIDGNRIGIISENIKQFTVPEGAHTIIRQAPNGQIIYKAEAYLAKNVTQDIVIP